MDVVLLSRLQFAMTIMFQYLFPPLTIGLGLVLVFLELQWLRTGESIYHQATRFWTKMFGINFALGVATGIVMEFQFGTNWAVYSRYVGDVFGSALAAEGIFAFFLASCLAVCALVLLLGLALFPNLVTSAPVPENSLTIYNAASSPKTLGIMLIMAVIGMPFVIAYTSIIYWVFRHRVSTGGSYG